MEWLPYSPDLNAIENLWKILKQKIYKHYPDLQTATDTEETRLRIVAAPEECWAVIEVEILRHLSDPIPHRVIAIQELEGWYTKYRIF